MNVSCSVRCESPKMLSMKSEKEKKHLLIWAVVLYDGKANTMTHKIIVKLHQNLSKYKISIVYNPFELTTKSFCSVCLSLSFQIGSRITVQQ